MLEGIGGKRAASRPDGNAPAGGPAKRPRSSELADSKPEGLPRPRGSTASSATTAAPRQPFVAGARPTPPAQARQVAPDDTATSASAPAKQSRGGCYRGYRKFDAAALKQTLTAILQARGEPAGASGPDPIDRIARQLNQTRQYVESWVNPDGSLKKQTYYVARLDGYETTRDELQALLRRLGHGEAATALPVEVPKKPPARITPSGEGASRRRLTANDVLTILTAAGKGTAAPQIQAEHGYSQTTVARWTSPAKWVQDGLSGNLSRMDGYATHRATLQELVSQLGLHAGPLPEPEKQLDSMTAQALCAALACLVERREHPQPGQNKFTMEAVRKAVGLNKDLIGNWLRSDGSLRLPLATLARLADFNTRRGELQALFARLGHAELAAAVPTAAAAQRTPVNVALVVRALEQAAKGVSSGRALAATLGIPAETLRGLVKVQAGGVLLARPEKLPDMPDYPAQRARLQQALRAVGLTEAAGQLPPILVPAADLLDGLRGMAREAGAAMAEMQRDPKLTAEEAAGRHGLPVDAFAAAVGPGGTVRSRESLETRLSNIEPHLSTGLDDLLAMLERAARGKAEDAAPAAPTMKRVQPVPGAHEPAKVFIVPQGETTGPKRGQLANLYASNVGLQRVPRDYSGERDRQALRWLATVLRLLLPQSTEIQCYFDERSGRIAVAAGKPKDNKRLEELLGKGKFLAHARDQLNQRRDSLSAREYRHFQKLFQHLSAHRKGEAWDPAADLVLGAVRRNAFVVPSQSFSVQGRTVSLHAERRLNHWSRETHGEPVDPARLAGTMRPCGTCADDLELDEKASRGPFWMTRAAQAFIDTEGAIQRQIDRSIGTSVTRTREKLLTIEVNTDSDSDA
jgi:hypothetical protein